MKEYLLRKLTLLLVFMLGALTVYVINDKYEKSAETVQTEVINKLEKEVTVTDNGIADAVDKVYDSVVVVSTVKNNKIIASGTGFVYDTDNTSAYLLTNYHVIEGGTSFYVSFTNGQIYETKYLGGDKYSDIAVLSIEKEKIISVIEIGNSENARMGDTVFAIGAPLDDAYSWSVTRGILSGKNRLVEVSLSNSYYNDYVMSVLQTDTAINSGNSGGPLSNSNGQVIGITSLKFASDGVEGMGFAIPIETALEYAEMIRSGQKIERPKVGLDLLNVSNAMYTRKYSSIVEDANISYGVIVTNVDPGSSAQFAGLQDGDIIIQFNDEKIKSIAYFKYALYSCKIGETADLKIIRDNREMTLKMPISK